MIWLLTEIAFLVGVALVVGVALGWLGARLVGRRRSSDDVDRLRSELDAVQVRSEELGSRNDALEAELAAADHERQRLEQLTTELRVARDDERRELADQMSAMARRTDTHDDDRAALRETLDGIRAELTTTRRVLAERTEQLSALRHELAECAARNEELAVETDELRHLNGSEGLGDDDAGQDEVGAFGDGAPGPAALARAIARLDARAQRHEELLGRLLAEGPDRTEGAAGAELTALHDRIASLEAAVGERNNEIQRLSSALGTATAANTDDLTRLPGVDDDLADALRERGFTRYKHLARLGTRDLEDVLAGIDGGTAVDAAAVIQRATRLHRSTRVARDGGPVGAPDPDGA